MPERYRSIIDVHVILRRAQEILLLERQNTGYCDGMLHLPSGHLEAGEPIPHGAAREARGEVGVDIDPGDLSLAAVVHHQAPRTAAPKRSWRSRRCRWSVVSRIWRPPTNP